MKKSRWKFQLPHYHAILEVRITATLITFLRNRACDFVGVIACSRRAPLCQTGVIINDYWSCGVFKAGPLVYIIILNENGEIHASMVHPYLNRSMLFSKKPPERWRFGLLKQEFPRYVSNSWLENFKGSKADVMETIHIYFICISNKYINSGKYSIL